MSDLPVGSALLCARVDSISVNPAEEIVATEPLGCAAPSAASKPAGLLTKATIITPQLRRVPCLAVVVDVACCPGDAAWSCDCVPGRTAHPNKSLATGILRQWIVAEIPRGKKVALPVAVPPGACLFKLTRPDDEPRESGPSAYAISFFDFPVPCPPEFPPKKEAAIHPCTKPGCTCCSEKAIPWCSVWAPLAFSSASTPPRSCLLIANIHGVEYARMFIKITRGGPNYEFGDFMLPRMLGLDDMDEKATQAARHKGAVGSAAATLRMAVHAVKRSIDAAFTAGLNLGRVLPRGYTPRSLSDVGALLAGHPTLTARAYSMVTSGSADSAGGGSGCDAVDSLHLIAQINEVVAVAVNHHMPTLEPSDRDKATRALQRQMRSILVVTTDPDSCSCVQCKAAVTGSYHCLGRIAAICCSAWWSASGALPDRPKYSLSAKAWNAPLFNDYAAAYLNMQDSGALGYAATDDGDAFDVGKKLDKALTHVYGLCKVASAACSPPGSSAKGWAAEVKSGSLPTDCSLTGGAGGPGDPLKEEYRSAGPACAGDESRPFSAPPSPGFVSPRGLAVVATMSLMLTVLHRESLWLHARLFPVFFEAGLSTPLVDLPVRAPLPAAAAISSTPPLGQSGGKKKPAKQPDASSATAAALASELSVAACVAPPPGAVLRSSSFGTVQCAPELSEGTTHSSPSEVVAEEMSQAVIPTSPQANAVSSSSTAALSQATELPDALVILANESVGGDFAITAGLPEPIAQLSSTAAVSVAEATVVSDAADGTDSATKNTHLSSGLLALAEVSDCALAAAKVELRSPEAAYSDSVKIASLTLSLQQRSSELEMSRKRILRERAAAKAELDKMRAVCTAAQAKAEADAARSLQDATRAKASCSAARAEAAVASEARRVAEAAIDAAHAEATEAAAIRWRATLLAAAAEDPATVLALRAQIAALKLAAAASAARADSLVAAAGRVAAVTVDAGSAKLKSKGGKKGCGCSPVIGGSASSLAAPRASIPEGVAADVTAAVAESGHLRAERDAALARATALESEVAAAFSRVHAALAAIGAPPLSSVAHLASSSVVGARSTAATVPSSAAVAEDFVAARAQFETLQAEVAAHKTALASAIAAANISAASFTLLREDGLAMQRRLEDSTKIIVGDSATRLAQAERNAAIARSAEITANRAAAEARLCAAKNETAVKSTSSALAALTQLHLRTATERDEALESVRRITAIAAEHERRCSELHAATCEVCNMCVRQQEELATVKREAEEALSSAGGFLRAGMVEVELKRALVIATQRQELQQQCDAARVRAEAAELLSGQRMDQLRVQLQRCERLQDLVKQLQSQVNDDISSNVVVMSVLGCLGTD